MPTENLTLWREICLEQRGARCCNDAVKTCSSRHMKRSDDEHDDGRRHLALDSEAQERAGTGHHSGQDNGSRSKPSLRFTLSEVEGWVEDGKRGMENALRANPLDVKEVSVSSIPS